MKVLLFAAVFLFTTFIATAQSNSGSTSGMQKTKSGKEKKKHKKHHKKHGKHHKKNKTKSTTFVLTRQDFV